MVIIRLSIERTCYWNYAMKFTNVFKSFDRTNKEKNNISAK